MKLKLKDLKPNPFKKYINDVELNEDRIEIIKESIDHGTLPEHFTARKQNGTFELTSGHHRHYALTEARGKNYEVDVSVVDFNDEQMLIDMVRENLTQRDTDFKDISDSCILAKRWLQKEFKGCNVTLQPRPGKRTDLGEDHIGARDIANFLSKKGKSISHNQVAKYLKIEESIPELKERVTKGSQGHTENGKIGLELSAKIASFDKSEQKHILEIVDRELANKQSQEKIIQDLTAYKDAPEEVKTKIVKGELDLIDVKDENIKEEVKEFNEKNPKFVFIPNFAGRLKEFDKNVHILEKQVRAFSMVFHDQRFTDRYKTLKPKQKKSLNELIFDISDRVKMCYDEVEFFKEMLGNPEEVVVKKIGDGKI